MSSGSVYNILMLRPFLFKNWGDNSIHTIFQFFRISYNTNKHTYLLESSYITQDDV
jgi:hypothetical protein